ncbi:hypothetical protein Back2_04040 [Nocardioides baekrokdamisoli]|uniref:Gram-positive cocci surface proteins LPxTG domain-containing protein n=1 Tax=Nocardioides baekrokdamisoli TaxID=1804624 RepID=A0A3G9IBC5_9ACTN|nr:hypothetical protein [Nocardioides baekrokdamisoli]BBH16117.1 hypothetical protein Back2_04040 [Nocardioides baekrokdamisoli]
MLFRMGARTVAAAGAVTVVGVLAAPALAATTVSQATAQSLKLSISGTPAVTQIVTASNDGTKQTKNNADTLPTLAQVLPTNNLLGAGVAPQDAGANANGTSFACAGIAGTGGGIVHTGNTACKLNGAPITLGLGNLQLGATTLDSTSVVGALLQSLGVSSALNGTVQPLLQSIISPVSSALSTTPLGLSIGGTLSAIEATCQATPAAASGATHLVDSQGGSKPVPITVTVPGQPPITVLQLPANPPVNTHLVVDLSTVSQTVINALKVELTAALGQPGVAGPLGTVATALGQTLQQVQDSVINTLVDQIRGPLLQPLQASVLDVTLNKQISSDSGKKIDVTALDLQVLPAAAQFAGGSLVSGQLGHVTCGPNTKASNNGGGNNGGGNNGGGNNGGTPGNPTVIPHGVDAGLAGNSDSIALTSALSGTALAAAAGLGLYRRRLAAR